MQVTRCTVLIRPSQDGLGRQPLFCFLKISLSCSVTRRTLNPSREKKNSTRLATKNKTIVTLSFSFFRFRDLDPFMHLVYYVMCLSV
jgi:hypothetical protein